MSNVAVVEAYLATFNAGDWPALRALFTPDASIRGVLGWAGVDLAMEVWKELHGGMTMRLSAERIVQDGDVAVALLNETGRFVGPFRGLAGQTPTGKAYELLAIEWFEFRDGLISRRWAARDSAAISRQVLD